MSICALCEADTIQNIAFADKVICTACYGEIIMHGLQMIKESVENLDPKVLARIVEETLRDPEV